MKEYIIRTDMFRNPLVRDGEMAKVLKILRLILLNPGADPLHPDMGVGITNYRFGTDETVSDLVQRTQEQIATYLPELVTSSVDFIVTDDKILSIEIMSNGQIYTYGDEDNPITVSDIAFTE